MSSAAFWLTAVSEALSAEHVNAAGVFREAGLGVDALADPDARFPSDSVSLLWELAIMRSGNPTVGLAGACRAKPGHFGVVAYSLMSAPDLSAILQRVVRYVGIVSDAADIVLQRRQEGHRLVLRLSAASRPVPHLRYAFDLLMVLSFCRWVTGHDLRSTEVELSHPGGDASAAFAATFGCTARFGATENALLFSHGDLGLLIPTAHDQLLVVHDRVAAEQLERISGPRLITRARAEISRRLPDGAPTRSEIALALATSERTLHRRLTEGGTSFQRLVDETRRELATTYLERRDLSLADVAYLLGFRDQSSFFRAAQRWFGATPRQYRRRAAEAAR